MAGFFEIAGTFRGESVGALKIDGEWVSEPEQGRAVIGLRTVDGKVEASIDRIALRQDTGLAEWRYVCQLRGQIGVAVETSWSFTVRTFTP